MSDVELVDLLKRPPKSTQVLRTKGNFQEFFKGISETRMRMLLESAYADRSSDEVGSDGEFWETEKLSKINKRMNLLRDVLATN